MKQLMSTFLLLFILSGCSTTQLVNHWKNPDIEYFEPVKVLVIGMTADIEAREKFEARLEEEVEARGAEGVMSLDIFSPTFTSNEKTEKQVKQVEYQLLEEGFDAILLTKIIGTQDKVTLAQAYRNQEDTYRGFRDDYFSHQDIYYNPKYYEPYTIYHAETALYCICPGKDRELIWKGSIDINDPKNADRAIDDYVKLVLLALEEQNLIPKKTKTNGDSSI